MLKPLERGWRIPPWALGPLVLALTALQMVRRPSAPPVWDSLYVEDGMVFLSQALSQHFLDSLATSYYGYLHTAPRLITLVATWVRLEDAPLVMSLLTSLVIALLAVYVFEASSAWIASPLLRGVLALALVLVPVTARDMAGTVGNLHFFIVYAAFWAVICPWRGRWWLLGSTAVVLLAVLSDPLCVVLLPLALVLSVRARRDWRAWVLPAAIAFGLVAQLALRDEGTSFFGGRQWGAIPRMFAERVTSSLLVGDRYLDDVFGGMTGSPFAWASLAFVALAVGAGLWRLRDRRVLLLAAGAALSVAFFLIPVLTRGTRLLAPDSPRQVQSSRYMYLPVMFLLTGLLATVDRREPGKRRRLPARELAAAGLVLAAIVASYRAPHRTTGEPRWKPALAQARTACATRRPVGPIRLYLRGRELTAVVPIDPPAHWYVPVDCSRLD